MVNEKMDENLWNKCVEFHGHACPGLALGYRAVEVASNELKVPMTKTPDEEIVCVVENDACGLDCIQVLFACTIGKGNLILRPTGKMAYSFFNRYTGESIRVVAKRMDRTGSREDVINRILRSSLEDIFMIKKPHFEVPEEARLFESLQCSKCGEFSREDKVRMYNGSMFCVDCFKEYDRG